MTDWTIAFQPLMPIWLLAAFAVAGVVFLAAGLVMRTRGSALRALAAFSVLLALANPIFLDEDRQGLRDVAVVVVDESASQKTGRRPEQTAAAHAAVMRQLGALPDLDVRVATVQSTPGGGGTQLFGALDSALADVPPDRFAGAIMITDGQIHDVAESGNPPIAGAPIHALLTGRPGEGDRRLVIEQAPRFGIVGQSQDIVLRIEDRGDLPPARTARLTVNVDGKTVSTIEAEIGVPVTVPVDIAHGGAVVTEIVVAEVPGELTVQNNRALVTTQGIRDRLRVLLVSGEPHAGERTWRNLLKADAAVDLVHFTILRPPEKQDGTPIRELSLIAFPTRELFSVKLDEFDLIIFDRYQRRGVLPLIYLSNVAEFVSKGGAVLSAAGPAFATPLSLYRTPLAAVLPGAPTGGVTTVPYRPAITAQGKRHPVTRNLPGSEGDEATWGRWLRLIDVEAESGDVVMSGAGDKPLMILKREGEGRVAQLLSDHAWLWARGYDGGGPQAELLRRLAHWLMKEPDLEEEALTATHAAGRLAIERRTMAESVSPVKVTAPSGEEKTVELRQEEPGLWRSGVEVTEAGVFRLDDGKVSSVVAVGAADPKEFSDIRATEEIVQPVVDVSGGGIYWLGSRAAPAAANVPRIRMQDAGRRLAGSDWLALRRNNAYIVRSLRNVPLISGLMALLVLLTLIGAAWYREGR